MNFLGLGTIARKTGFKPKKNIPRDEYGMEDIDEYFKTDREDTTRGSFMVPSIITQETQHDKDATTTTRHAQSSTKVGNNPSSSKFLKNVARKIEFNDEETKSFNLSPINPLVEINKSIKVNKKSPLRSPLSETKSKDRPRIGHNNSDSFEEGGSGCGSGSGMVEKISRRPSKLTSTATSSSTSSSSSSKKSSHNQRLRSPATIYKESEEYLGTSKQVIDPSPLPSPPPDLSRRSKRIREESYSHRGKVPHTTTTVVDKRGVPVLPQQQILGRTNNRKQPPRRAKVSPLPPTAAGTGTIVSGSERNRDRYLRESGVPGSHWHRDGHIDMMIKTSRGDMESRTVAYSGTSGDFIDLSNNADDGEDNCRVAKLFDHDNDLSATVLVEIPYRGSKSRQHTGNSVYIFHVIRGLMEITLNDQTFVVNKGCSFEIPDNNEYSIKNIGDRDAKLFLVQVRTPDIIRRRGESHRGVTKE